MGEIDLKGRFMDGPGDRMKTHREHRVPLSPAALRLLESLPRFEDGSGIPQAERGSHDLRHDIDGGDPP